MAEDVPSSPGPSTGSAAPSPAKLRAEARKQRILSHGNVRLAKITGAMKNRYVSISEVDGAQASNQDSSAPEPPDVDISQLDSEKPPAQSVVQPISLNSGQSISGNSIAKQSASFVNQDEYLNYVNRGRGMQENPPPTSPFPDPMLQMIKAMGLEIPTGGLLSESMLDNQANANPMLQQTFSDMNGGAQQPTGKTWNDQIFSILNLLIVGGLVLSAMFWWSPMSAYWSQFQSLSPRKDEEIDLNAEWAALHPPGSSPAVRQALGPAPIFWMFVTIELALQATRWIFNTRPASPGLLGTLAYSLPRPYSTFAATGMRYYAILSSLIDDLSVLVFGVGCAVVWLEWQNSSDKSFQALVFPA
ncbi:hypothetical protein O181_030688 [Austropuccinia psidii MF-1]|uniref:Uncharacterized protein n=1 Tax=Austropuccinia psidii MF-1 TaxID=1389203 RepID=A0A9Q3H3X2_9BASI|nr:hypothetical protein [Austropuccinia psidii MF-1]